MTSTQLTASGTDSKENGKTYIVVMNQKKCQAQIPFITKNTLNTNTCETGRICSMSNTFKLGAPGSDIPSKTKTKSVVKGFDCKKNNETIKMNFSSMSFDDYDSSTTSKMIFNDDDRSRRNNLLPDEGYSEEQEYVEIGDLPKIVEKNSELNPFGMPTNQVSLLKKTQTPCAGTKMDISGSSGYFSGGSSFFNSPNDMQQPSPCSLEQNKRQRSFVSPMVKPSETSNDSILSSSSSASPVTCLSSNLKCVNLFQSQQTVEKGEFSQNTHTLPSKSPCPSNHSPLLSETEVQRHIMHQHLLKRTGATIVQCKQPLCNLASLSKSKNDKAQVIEVDHHSSLSKSKLIQSGNPAHSSSAAAFILNQPSVSFPLDNQHVNRSVTAKPGDLILHFDVRNNFKKCESELTCVNLRRSVEMSEDSQDAVSSSQESIRSEQDELDTSLTNMHWLRSVQGIQELRQETASKAVSVESRPREGASNPVQWRYLSAEDVHEIAKECGTKKRPPFSYMTLIQLALRSREDKRMTLKEICHWIEDTFPFYQKTAKPGWKNSIRHNLSLYSIFEREKTKKHGSYWTVREDCPEKSKVQPNRDARKDESPSLPAIVPIPLNLANTILPTTGLPQSTGTNGKKGPPPILPRPVPFSPTMQSYALIPIQSLNQQVPGLSVVSQGCGSASSAPKISENVLNNCAEDPMKSCHMLRSRFSNIAPKRSSSTPSSITSTTSSSSISFSRSNTTNIVRQAWLDSQNITQCENDKDSNNSSHMASTTENSSKKVKLKNGLPQPVFYERKTPPSRKTKGRRKQKLIPKEKELMNFSSDEDSAKFIAELEEDIESSKVKDTSGVSSASGNLTSTPFKQVDLPSPNLMSPIQSFTPLRTSAFLDGSFLDCLKDFQGEGKESLSPDMMCSKRLNMSSTVFSGQAAGNLLTPSKGMQDIGLVTDQNQSLSKLLADIDDADAFPVDLGDLNWSGLEQDPSFIHISPLISSAKKDNPS